MIIVHSIEPYVSTYPHGSTPLTGEKGRGLEKRSVRWHALNMQTNKEPMDASLQFCSNESCSARGQMGAGNISIHGRKRPRYKCHGCGKTFSERKGTMLEGLRTDEEKVLLVGMLLAYGCPLQAIVHAFGFDERTVAAWQRRAGTHCKRVHMDVVQQGNVKSQHIQADAHTSKRKKNRCLDCFSDGCDHTLMACRDGESAPRSHAH